MMQFIYTNRSLEDFDKILKRIGEDNPTAAIRLGEDIDRVCMLLKSQPLMGESKDNLAKGMRRFVCRGYGLYYRIDEENQTVNLLRIIHPRVDIRRQTFD